MSNDEIAKKLYTEVGRSLYPDPDAPEWLKKHRESRTYSRFATWAMTPLLEPKPDALGRVAETAFNNHKKNTGAHVSPFDTGKVVVGTEGLEVRLAQGVDMDQFKQTVAAGTLATIGRARPLGPGPISDSIAIESEADWQDMFRGGLQTALESQVLVFEVWGASRVLTHQLVRSRRAGFHQQSQRSTWMGDRPEVRMPETVWRAPLHVRKQWLHVYREAWIAYQRACDAGVPYEDARYILPEGTVGYIQCEYTVREFINVFAYRGCSMFLREMVFVMRAMRDLVVAVNPELEPYIKISCEKTGKDCERCKGTGMVHSDGVAATENDILIQKHAVEINEKPPYSIVECWQCGGKGSLDRKCTFQGWENVELACNFPWARESNRIFLANPKLRIGAK